MNPLLSWECYEHVHIERGRDWYWALGVVVVSGALTSILLSNVLLALILILAGIILGLIASQPPELVTVSLFEKGLRVGEITYQWSDVLSFWVEDQGPSPLLLIDTTKFLSPNLIITIPEYIDPEELRGVMGHFAEEKFLQEPWSHKLVELLGF